MWTFNWDCATQSLKPCKLQKRIPNHQFSFCWIYQLLLTLLTIIFSWPPSHHWPSQGFPFIGLNPISMAGLSRWPGEGRYPQNINWSLGFLRDWFLDPPPLLHIHYITGSHHTSTWFLLPFICWWHTAPSLILTRWSNGSCMDLRLPGRHLGVDEITSPTAQPGKDWASCLPCNSNSKARFHHPVLLQLPHLVCIAQHQKDQALPYTAYSTTSCPGPCHG